MVGRIFLIKTMTIIFIAINTKTQTEEMSLRSSIHFNQIWFLDGCLNYQLARFRLHITIKPLNKFVQIFVKKTNIRLYIGDPDILTQFNFIKSFPIIGDIERSIKWRLMFWKRLFKMSGNRDKFLIIFRRITNALKDKNYWPLILTFRVETSILLFG
jgi:hypothetical protein